MRRILHVPGMGAFRDLADLDRAISERIDALIRSNESYLLANPDTPSLYHAAVYYSPDPPGLELFPSIPELYSVRAGDCAPLAAARVAELRVSGLDAHAYLTRQDRGEGEILYHVQVQHPDGTIEDPSIELGMSRAA